MRLIPFLALFLSVCSLSAAPFLVISNPPPVITLAWNTVPGLSYRIYYGVGSRAYTNAISVGATNGTSITLPGRGPTYFFAASAVDTNGLQSDFSTEVFYTPAIPPAPPLGLLPPLVLTVKVKQSTQDVLWSDAGMTWTFNPQNSTALFRLEISPFVP